MGRVSCERAKGRIRSEGCYFRSLAFYMCPFHHVGRLSNPYLRSQPCNELAAILWPRKYGQISSKRDHTLAKEPGFRFK